MSDARVRPRLSTPLLAMVLCLVWSSAFVFVKLGLRDAPAEVFAAGSPRLNPAESHGLSQSKGWPT